LPGNKEIAQAFIKEAEADIRSAKLLLSGKEYSQTIVHCQHAVEKILKAALALRNIIITKQHVVSPDFVAAFSDLGEVNPVRKDGALNPTL
jgi:HEPN domain-containing protein